MWKRVEKGEDAISFQANMGLVLKGGGGFALVETAEEFLKHSDVFWEDPEFTAITAEVVLGSIWSSYPPTLLHQDKHTGQMKAQLFLRESQQIH